MYFYHLELLFSFLNQQLTVAEHIAGHVHLLIGDFAAAYSKSALLYGPESLAVTLYQSQFFDESDDSYA